MSNLFKKIKGKIKRHFWPIYRIPLNLHFLWSDRSYLEYLYYHRFKKRISLSYENKDLYLFTEKIQWLKLYDRQPEYTNMADKYNVRKYVAETIGEEYLIPCYGVWDKFEDIPFDALPNQFVLKCTHDCGSVFFCRDKKTFDIKKAKVHFKKRLSRNFYWRSRQWVYKNIKPRIIAEKYLVDESGTELKDYKIFCFNGKPKYLEVHFDRFISHKRNLYTLQWEYLPVSLSYPTVPDIVISKPKPLELMLELAGKLSAGKIHVRVDMYVTNETIYFGEFTFYSFAGFERFEPPEWDRKFGDLINLPI